MRNILLLCTISAVLPAAAPAQAPLPDPPNPLTTTKKPVTVIGLVNTFEPGKVIEVNAKGISHRYDLSKTETVLNVDPNLKVGDEVRMIEQSDDNGHKTVTIEPTSKNQRPRG